MKKYNKMTQTKSDTPRTFTIRPALADDHTAISALWLKGSLQAHPFVAATYWKEQLHTMSNDYLPSCECWVLEADHGILGFSAMHDDELSALFVHADRQGQGYGVALLNHAKQLRPLLWLAVYEQNQRALLFYQQQGFRNEKRQRCENTQVWEWVMRRKDKDND